MRLDKSHLIPFCAELLRRAGMAADAADIVADRLVEADRLGHDTHGLHLLPSYVAALQSGQMKAAGAPRVINDLGAAIAWDGEWLSGVWLIVEALELASARARQYGVATVSIARAHHTACLQAYLPTITERGQVALLMVSDPINASVVPHGGLDGALSTDPLAVGVPTDDKPILIDMSTSITTNGMAARNAALGQPMNGPWLQDAQGAATADPAVLSDNGTLLPTGGQDHGHKGFAMGLIVETLAQGLSGYGRATPDKAWGAAVLVQVFDPAAFAGREAFTQQSGEIARRCLASRPHPELGPVRLPGHGALARRAAAGELVPLRDSVVEGLKALSQSLDVPFPEAAA